MARPTYAADNREDARDRVLKLIPLDGIPLRDLRSKVESTGMSPTTLTGALKTLTEAYQIRRYIIDTRESGPLVHYMRLGTSSKKPISFDKWYERKAALVDLVLQDALEEILRHPLRTPQRTTFYQIITTVSGNILEDFATLVRKKKIQGAERLLNRPLRLNTYKELMAEKL